MIAAGASGGSIETAARHLAVRLGSCAICRAIAFGRKSAASPIFETAVWTVAVALVKGETVVRAVCGEL